MTVDPHPELTFCLIVPSGSWRLAALVGSIRSHSPASTITAVWCGDPHFRPVLDEELGVDWCDVALEEPNGLGWGRLLCMIGSREYEWSRAAAAVARLLDSERVVATAVIRVGSAAVLGDPGALVGDSVVTLARRSGDDLSAADVDDVAGIADIADGLAPNAPDRAAAGSFSVVVAGFRDGAQAALGWIGRRLLDAPGGVGPVFESLADRVGVAECSPDAVVVGGWSNQLQAAPSIVDLDDLDRAEPWRFAFASGPARVRLSAEPLLSAAVAASLPQLAGEPAAVCLPGGIAVDAPMRAVVAASVRDARRGRAVLPPEPFGPDNARFVEWLEQPSPTWGADFGRYWRELRAQRPDLCVIFPRPDSFDQRCFVDWIETSWRFEERSAMLRASSQTAYPPLVDAGHDPRGVNVVGYHTYDLSLGLIAREIVNAFRAAGVDVAAIDHRRTGSPHVEPAPVTTREMRYSTNIAVVNADQFEFLVSDYGDILGNDRRSIAYWFWELEHIPADMIDAIEQVDEIWVGSRFVQHAFAAVTDKPVRHVPIPVGRPTSSARTRGDFGLPTDRFVFVTTFDHFSIAERKNPFGAIEAFRREFADGEGPLLLVKTTNGDTRWANHERVLLAAAGRKDIRVWDEHLSRADQMAVLGLSDCLVSLHRSEGLGLHCAEAMWLGTPVIATRYSGNLDFMDDRCSALVDYRMTPVEHGEGVYPPTAMWADPDLGQAAFWMRRFVDEPDLCATLSARALTRMQEQPTMAATGRMMAGFVGPEIYPIRNF